MIVTILFCFRKDILQVQEKFNLLIKLEEASFNKEANEKFRYIENYPKETYDITKFTCLVFDCFIEQDVILTPQDYDYYNVLSRILSLIQTSSYDRLIEISTDLPGNFLLYVFLLRLIPHTFPLYRWQRKDNGKGV